MDTFLLLVLFGCLVGFIGGYAGIGGAPFLVAILVALFDMTQFEAQGTVLAVMLGPMSLMSVLSLWDKVKPNIREIIIGVVSYALMSYLGATLAYQIPEKTLKLLFAILLILLGIYNIYSRNKKVDTDSHSGSMSISTGQMLTVGSGVGVVGGLFGIGAGVLMVPIFINIFKVNKDVARAISLAILLPPVSIGAVIKYSQEGAINWRYAIILFFCYFFVNYFGGKLGAKHGLETFKKYFGIILILLGLVYIYLL